MYRALIGFSCVALAVFPKGADGAIRERVADLPNESAISAFGDLAVVSVFEGDKFRLMLLRGNRLEPLPVPRSRSAFDVDMGPDERNRPTIVYALRNHAIYRLRIGATSPKRVATGVHPTVWRNTIAYARSHRTRDQVTIRTGSRTRRLAARGLVEELELRGSVLAIDSVQDERNEIERVSLASRSRRVVARSSMGLSGLDFVGLSLTAEHVAWHRSCYGDDAGCRTNGAQRLNVRTGAYQSLVGRYQPLSGFALIPDGLLEINGGPELGERSEGATTDCDPRCPVNRVTDLDWKKIKSPVH